MNSQSHLTPAQREALRAWVLSRTQPPAQTQQSKEMQK